jgi:predicted nucleotidyltransferase
MDNGKLKDFVGRLVKTFPEDFWGAVLFGSRARGDATPDSDADAFVPGACSRSSEASPGNQSCGKPRHSRSKEYLND